MRKMRIFRIPVEGDPHVKEISGDIASLQQEVGGYIEPLRVFSASDLEMLGNEGGD